MNTTTEVMRLLNSVVDDVLEALDADDEGLRDALNLVVNVVAHRMDHPDGTVADAIRAAYDADPETVISWCQS